MGLFDAVKDFWNDVKTDTMYSEDYKGCAACVNLIGGTNGGTCIKDNKHHSPYDYCSTFVNQFTPEGQKVIEKRKDRIY